MRLLIVNPNTSAETNSRILALAESETSENDVVEVVSADSGIELIENVEQSNATVPAVVALVKSRSHAFDGTIIAAFSDPGLEQARAVATCPVIGISEAAMRVASHGAERFAIITLGAALGEAIRRNAEAYGFAGQLAAIRILPWTVAQVSANPAAYREAFADECRRAVVEDGAEAVIIGGGPLSGMADAIAARLPVPVLDGVRCAVQLMAQARR